MNSIRPRRPRSAPELSPELCAHLRIPVDDPGPTRDAAYLSDIEYEALVSDTLRRVPDHRNFWLFAYGSLMWKPDFVPLEQRVGLVRGFHRSFCLKTTRWRGTPERPGLMMALQKGGQCRGIVCRLDPATLEDDLMILFRRELGVKPLNHRRQWVRALTDEGEVSALTFVANPKGMSYAGKLSLDETARMIAQAVGVWGSCAEYIYETIRHLERFGIRDQGLWKLQSLVARSILDERKGIDVKTDLQ
jgi:cation transport protein ChaC